jgi:5-methylcytosine-specific restriction endonuclease McrA
LTIFALPDYNGEKERHVLAQKALEQPTLLLNKNWQPIQTRSVKEAIGLVAKGSAFIVDTETFERHDLNSWNDVSKAKAKFGDVVIRSSSLSLVPPEVIVLTEYDGISEGSVVFSRRNIFKRDRYTCMYCGVQPGPDALTIDHIKPRSRGGISSWANCVLACVDCNKVKADRTPEEAGMKLRKVPKKPTWKALARISPQDRRESWASFLSRAYWDAELES